MKQYTIKWDRGLRNHCIWSKLCITSNINFHKVSLSITFGKGDSLTEVFPGAETWIIGSNVAASLHHILDSRPTCQVSCVEKKSQQHISLDPNSFPKKSSQNNTVLSHIVAGFRISKQFSSCPWIIPYPFTSPPNSEGIERDVLILEFPSMQVSWFWCVHCVAKMPPCSCHQVTRKGNDLLCREPNSPAFAMPAVAGSLDLPRVTHKCS